MSIAARIKALNLSELRAMERHGKRLDEIGKARQVNDTPALTFNGLDIVDAQAKHVAGCRINTAAQKICQHALIQFPTDIPVTEENQQLMLDSAVDFINHVYGGDAVFAARLDRDEAGKHSVDVFFAPKYLKETAKTRRGEAESDLWISNTKHGKDLCHQHRDEITERNRQMAELKRAKNEEAGRNVLIGPIQGTFSTGPGQVGIALQSEIRQWTTQKVPEFAVLIKSKKQKQSLEPDRLEPEEYGLREDRAALEREREEIKAERSKVEADRREAKAYASKMRSVADEEWALAAKGRIEAQSLKKPLEALALSLNERQSRLEAGEARLAKAMANIDQLAAGVKRVLNDMALVVHQWTRTLGLTVPEEIKQVSELQEAVAVILRDNAERIAEQNLENQDYDEASFERPPAPE
jgi:hypothetical protein